MHVPVIPTATWGAAVRTWMRRLDEDALSGLLWRRPVVFGPLYLLTGTFLGLALGFGVGLLLAVVLPTSSVQAGPDGAPITILNDYSPIPLLTGLAGAATGTLTAGLLAAARWRRHGW